MIGKVCRAPAGGTARGLQRYILGGVITPAHRDEGTREEALSRYYDVLAEADARADQGVGVAWSPANAR